MLVNDYGSFTIYGWMVNLELPQTELMVLAIIFGATQDGESWFKGSRQYLSDWCGCTVRSIQYALNNLVAKQLIEKEEELIHGVKVCKYRYTGD